MREHGCYYLLGKTYAYICLGRKAAPMKNFLSIIIKVVLKICAALAFVVVAVFGFLIRPFAKLVRLAVLPLALICGASAVMELHTIGFSMAVVLYSLLAILLGITYFALPYMPAGITFVKGVLRDVMSMQVIVRSPVKYTL